MHTLHPPEAHEDLALRSDPSAAAPGSDPAGGEAPPPRLLRRIARRHRRRVALLSALALLVPLAAAGYQADVYANRMLRANAEISIEVRAEPLGADVAADAPAVASSSAGDRTEPGVAAGEGANALVFFDGFGSYDADHLVDTLGPGVQRMLDGEVWSVSYGNAPLASEKIAEQIVERAAERGTRQLDLVGYSMGGIIALEAAAYLAEQRDLSIRSITLVSTPDGLDGLRPFQRQQLDAAEGLARIPGAQFSTVLRFIGEVYFLHDRYTRGGPQHRVEQFVRALGVARDHVSGPRATGSWLLVDQAFATAAADLGSELAKIAERVGTRHPLPTLLYLGTGAPGHDYMVDDKTSAENICAYAAQQGIGCFASEVPGAVHTRPEYTVDAYDETLAAATETVRAGIARAQLVQHLRLTAKFGWFLPEEVAAPAGPSSNSGAAEGADEGTDDEADGEADEEAGDG